MKNLSVTGSRTQVQSRATRQHLRDSQSIHVRFLLSFQQPTFQKFTNTKVFSAAWFAFRLKHVVIMIVLSEIMKGRFLKGLSDHPVKHAKSPEP